MNVFKCRTSGVSRYPAQDGSAGATPVWAVWPVTPRWRRCLCWVAALVLAGSGGLASAGTMAVRDSSAAMVSRAAEGVARSPTAWPSDGSWAYDVDGSSKGFGYSADATLTWQRTDTRYEAQLQLRAFLFGGRTQRSTGRLTPDGLQPTQFTDQARKTRRADLDWSTQRATLNTAPQPLPLPAGTQDRLSVLFQLGFLVQQGGAPTPGQRWAVPVLGNQQVDIWTFELKGLETLNLPAGRTTAWHLSRLPRTVGSAPDSSVDVWLDPAQGHLPVRVRLGEPDGDVVDQQLRGD